MWPQLVWNIFVEKRWVPCLGQRVEKRKATENETQVVLQVWHLSGSLSQKKPWAHETLEIDRTFGEGTGCPLIWAKGLESIWCKFQRTTDMGATWPPTPWAMKSLFVSKAPVHCTDACSWIYCPEWTGHVRQSLDEAVNSRSSELEV